MTSLNWYDSAERFRSDPAPFAGALQEYYTNIFRERFRQRKNLIDKITTAEQAADYVKNIRSAIKSRFRFPAVKTQLDAQTLYRRDMGDHIIEGVTFFSRPGVAVSGLFAAPAAPGPHPAVLFLCGHSAGGKFLFFHLLFWVYKIILFTVCQRWHIFPGFFMITLKELSELCGLSVRTVGRALNGSGYGFRNQSGTGIGSGCQVELLAPYGGAESAAQTQKICGYPFQ